jgi:hypothetical protein
MTYRGSRPLIAVLGLLVVVGLPLAGKWARRHRGPRCELDGLALVPLYQVTVLDHAGVVHRFCCVGCARLWLARQEGQPRTVYVTDEMSGEEIDARSAYFVRSPVVTNPVTGNRVHAFRHRADAEGHASAFGGELVTEAERPF